MIYIHRYHKYTIGLVRTEYLYAVQRCYLGEIERIKALEDIPEMTPQDIVDGRKRIDALNRKLKEIRDYDPVIAYFSIRNIELDLDDGIKVNYAKFQGVEVTSITDDKPRKMDLFTKI